ncbi:MAG: hypothetical protein HY466_04400 [Deltaproteobacteria bacterium]|nr:hypothetical protein [Deltaproteobacteria bacterium]
MNFFHWPALPKAFRMRSRKLRARSPYSSRKFVGLQQLKFGNFPSSIPKFCNPYKFSLLIRASLLHKSLSGSILPAFGRTGSLMLVFHPFGMFGEKSMRMKKGPGTRD